MRVTIRAALESGAQRDVMVAEVLDFAPEPGDTIILGVRVLQVVSRGWRVVPPSSTSEVAVAEMGVLTRQISGPPLLEV